MKERRYWNNECVIFVTINEGIHYCIKFKISLKLLKKIGSIIQYKKQHTNEEWRKNMSKHNSGCYLVLKKETGNLFFMLLAFCNMYVQWSFFCWIQTLWRGIICEEYKSHKMFRKDKHCISQYCNALFLLWLLVDVRNHIIFPMRENHIYGMTGTYINPFKMFVSFLSACKWLSWW